MMGNREDLLAGARKAVLERGLAKTTARDIAGAAGVSLAAIGYHFGSKDRLVTEMLTESVGAGIGDELEAIMRAAGKGRSVSEAAPAIWAGMLDVARRNRESLLLSMENGLRIVRSPESQRYMAEAVGRAHQDLANVLREVHPDLSAEQAEAVAKLYFSWFQGIALMWLLAPTADLLDSDGLATALEVL